MNNIYYPITQFHILLSQLTSKDGDTIVLDRKLFDQALIERVCRSEAWKNIFLLDRKNGTSGFFERFIIKKGEVGKLLSVNGSKIIFFTYGDRFCVFAVNHLSKKNEIIMMEDGLAPYYMQDIAREWTAALSKEEKAPLFDLLWFINHIKTDSSFINSLEVLEPELLGDAVRNQWKCKRVELRPQTVINRLDTVNAVFNYTAYPNTLNYDIVYFDTDFNKKGYANKEFDILYQLFSTFSGKKVLVKFRNRKRGGVGINRLKLLEKLRNLFSGEIIIDLIDSDYPWEVMFMNNQEALKGAIFISMGISTVMITPKVLFKRDQTSIICGKIFLSEFMSPADWAVTEQFMQRFNRLDEKKQMYLPESLDEIKTIIGR